MSIRDEDALDYHRYPSPGKTEVVPTKPFVTQRDLSLAYTPGVAIPCLEIAKDISKVYDYTGKGNLVAVISNGTAVLGLGDIGPEASKPVMEGKAGLFKTFADINVFDIELNSKNSDEIIRAIEMMGPTFGGINLEDIKGPECFYIEQELQRRLDIPVFHDDQHGTAIISGAALINACEITGKKINEIKVVYNGAGAAGFACAKFHIALGVDPKNVLMCDSIGVIYKGREKGMNEFKDEFAIESDRRTLADAFVDADVFVGLSQGNVVSKDMVRSMATNPIVFAMANPISEISYNDALDARPDVLMATGRSDYPNQVNNVLGFPFIFRGALDVFAKSINLEMKVAAAKAIAQLAKEEVPDTVKRAYGVEEMSFGKDYIIPKPFDPRVLTIVAPAVAKAAMDSGVARKHIENFDDYVHSLNVRMGRAQTFMSLIYKKAKTAPKRVVFPEAYQPRIIKAAMLCIDEGIAHPILIGNKDTINEVAVNYGYDITGIEIVDPESNEKSFSYINEYWNLRKRKGVTKYDAQKTVLRNRNYFGSLMVRMGDADVMISGSTSHYSATIKPAIEIIGHSKDVSKVSGLFIVSTKHQTYFLTDTTVNIDPTAEELADIALLAADFAKKFDITPKVALLSYSNFGSAKGDSPQKMRDALAIIKKRDPSLMVDGEMQADTAIVPEILESTYSFSDLKEGANILVFPNLDAGNSSYKLLARIGGAKTIGPVLLGLDKPIHVLQTGAEVNEIMDVVAIAVVDAQDRQKKK
ncbi:MAG: NADP-dependent malic enzyme [Candidatus Kapabacteria bacterium]|nr:NADP-dependent malic enzyme [Candidatus Kapabacteria bacterium]